MPIAESKVDNPNVAAVPLIPKTDARSIIIYGGKVRSRIPKYMEGS